MEGTYLNIIKTTDEKPTANIILNDERSKTFPLRSGTRQGCPLSPLLFNTVLTGSPRQSGQAREINRGYQNWKGRRKTVSICRIHDFIYRKS